MLEDQKSSEESIVEKLNQKRESVQELKFKV